MQGSKFRRALRGLGVSDTTLSETERELLDREGYLVFPALLERTRVSRIRRSMEILFAKEQAGDCVDIQNKSLAFDIGFLHPRVLAAVSHVLRAEFRSLGIHSRPNRPGHGHQALHMDGGGHAPARGEYMVCNSIWMLADFTKENGATRVVPGTHRLGKAPDALMEDPQSAHEDQVLMLGEAGTVVVFNAHLWHGATQNRSRRDRPNFTSFWCRRDHPVVGDNWGALTAGTRRRLQPAARQLFASV